MSVQVSLATRLFEPADALRSFTAEIEEGAIVSFTGYARASGRSIKQIDAMVLESYRGVTLASMKAIAADAMERFEVERCVVIHRAGRIEPKEAIVFVAAASTHRRAAFEAADYLMDRLKTEAVFWKREEGMGDRSWIEPTGRDYVDAARWNS